MLSGTLGHSACCLLLLAALVRAGDTTYSDTRAIPRQSSSGESGGGGRTSHPDRHAGEGDDSEWSFQPSSGSRSSSSGTCEVNPDRQDMTLGALFFIPFSYALCWGVVGLFMSHVHLLSGDSDMDGFRPGRVRLGFGADLGAMWLTGGESRGPTLVPHVDALVTVSPGHHLGLRAGFSMSGDFNAHDYARTALVEGRPIGDETDRLSGYDTHAVPVTLEYHLSSSAGLTLSVGAGAAWLRERIDYTRTWTYKRGVAAAVEERSGIRPMASLAVGRFASRNREAWARFGLRYQAIWLDPERRSSFPGDHAEVRHSLAWDWSLIDL